LHGGGLHTHSTNGKLNVHLDYAIHPKLGLQRKLNLIVYLNDNWKEEWGGHIEFWSHDETKNAPKECVKKVAPLFNRAVLFDTTQNSWHGLPEPLKCPDGEMRKSLAVYYLTDVDAKTQSLFGAKFAPYKEQEKDQSVLDLIDKRNNNIASLVRTYR
jgi:Rps23 Pro-64 3,4-dihydroxylase Tpa1-like proline 4-hydroxylase